MEAGLNSAARARSGSSHSGIGDGAGSSSANGEDEEEDMAGYDGPAFELRVFRDMWRCLMLCWDEKARGLPRLCVVPRPSCRRVFWAHLVLFSEAWSLPRKRIYSTYMVGPLMTYIS